MEFMEILSAREIAKYLKINEKKVYQLAKDSALPHLWIGGKIAFTREIIDRWILESTEGADHIKVAGSDDPLFRRLIDLFNGAGGTIVFYAPVGSVNGLKALKEGAASASCAHLLSAETGRYDVSYIARYLGDGKYHVIHLFGRDQGIYTAPGNPLGLQSLADVAGKGLKFVNRRQGSGTRILLDFLLKRDGIAVEALKGYEHEVESHLQAGMQVLTGKAACAFGIQHVAHILGLGFVPCHREEFHFVLPEENLSGAPITAFTKFLEQPTLLRYAIDSTGYDLSRMGQVLL
jgi:putative molybdopterin biosynthesis protein